MLERFVEIDARAFLDGTLTSRRGFQLTGPGTRKTLGFHGNHHVLTEGLTVVLLATPSETIEILNVTGAFWRSFSGFMR